MAIYLSSATPDLTRTTTTNTPPTWASKLTHTISVENGKTYALIWMCVLDGGTENLHFFARFRNTTDGVDLSNFVDGQTPITQRQPFGGMALFTAASTTTKTFAIEFAGAATNAAGCQQARIMAFELESSVDFWAASNTDSSRASTTYLSKVAVTVNPAAASNFLICASYAANLELQSKINDGSSDIYLHDRHDYWGVGATLRHPSFWFTKRAISSPTTFDLLAASGTGTSLICHAYIVALDLAKFAGNLYGESLTQGDSTGAYASRATVSGAVNAGNHLVLGSAIQFGSTTAVDLSNHKLRAAAVDIGVPIQFRIDGTTYKYSAFMMSIENLSAGSPTIDWQWARNSGTATHSILSNVVAALELAAASAGPVYTQVAYRFYNDDGSGLGESVTAIAAPDFFVDFTGGLDANDGLTSATAWKNLSKVHSTSFSPGDVIAFKRGETWTGSLQIDNSGTAGSPITFTAYGAGANPHIQNPSGGTFADGIVINASWVILENFTVTQARQIGIRIQSGSNNIIRNNEVHKGAGELGIGVYVQGQSNLITQNYVHDLTMVVNDATADNDYGAVAFWIENHNNEVSYNTAENCKATSIDYGFDGGCVEVFNYGDNTHVHHNLAVNTYGFMEFGSGNPGDQGAAGCRVHHNILINTVTCFCMHNSGAFAIPITDLRFENNTVYKNDGEGFRMFDCTTDFTELTSRNNIFNVDITISVNGTYTHQDNLYNMTGGAIVGFTLHGSEITGDPLFVSPGVTSAADFHLQTGSPAINTGQSLGYTEDFGGTSIPQGAGPDMGAYERA